MTDRRGGRPTDGAICHRTRPTRHTLKNLLVFCCKAKGVPSGGRGRPMLKSDQHIVTHSSSHPRQKQLTNCCPRPLGGRRRVCAVPAEGTQRKLSHKVTPAQPIPSGGNWATMAPLSLAKTGRRR
ncbi:hypothetical protein niasHT_000135 [Heterodera trifolii]|uniref:Uncharacterized protein n=1 Tax=Heterodera trifolii TaxID=157864 RepID=A0ABD2M307_9BILA